MHLIKKAESLGWKLTCSLDVSSKYLSRNDAPDVKLDVHSLFFCKDKSEDLFRSSYTRFPGPKLGPEPSAPLNDDAEAISHQPSAPVWIVQEPPPPSYKDSLKDH